MKLKMLMAVLLLSFSIFSTLVYASNTKTYWDGYSTGGEPLPGPLQVVLKFLGAPEDFLTWPGFIWRFLVP